MLTLSKHWIIAKRLLPLLPLNLLLGSGVIAWADNSKHIVCCRAPAGTRDSCPTLWAHLVPPENRLNPGPNSQIAMIIGNSVKPVGITLRLLTINLQPISEHLLEPLGAGVTVLTLPSTTPSSVVWESFPTCAPDRPPNRSLLDRELPQGDSTASQMMRRLGSNCGGSVDTTALLRAFDLETLQWNLPATLPVRCETLWK